MIKSLSARKQDTLVQFETALRGLKWDDDSADTSLDVLHEFTTGLALEQIQWYGDHKRKNRGFALTMRGIAIVALLVGMTLQLISLQTPVPVAPEIGETQSGFGVLRWSYIMIAFAGIALAADRWTGRSKALIRQTMAWLSLSEALSDFYYAWPLEKRAFANLRRESSEPPAAAPPPRDADAEEAPAEGADAEQAPAVGAGAERAPAVGADAAQAPGGQSTLAKRKEASIISMIELLRGLATEVQRIVREETENWSKDYDRIADELTKRVKTAEDSLKPGTIEAKLVDNEKVTSPVTLLLDGFGHASVEADSYLFSNVLPGSHIVEAEWQSASGETRRTSTVVTLAPGKKVTAPLSLKSAG